MSNLYIYNCSRKWKEYSLFLSPTNEEVASDRGTKREVEIRESKEVFERRFQNIINTTSIFE